MLKLTKHVFGWNPDSRVADFYERALLNHIRASQHPDGRVIYNLSLEPGGHKTYQTLFDSFTCCVGTGMENHVKYGAGIYFHNDKGLWVNLFIPSTLDWKERGIELRHETDWPYGDSTTISISSDEPREWTLRLREPHWAKDGVHVTLNGAAVEVQSSPSGYVEIRREWNDGDRVRLHFPMSLYTEAMPDNENRIAVLYGPTVLAADLGVVDDPSAQEVDYVPVLVTENRPVDQWLQHVDKLAFQTHEVGKPRDVGLMPFFAVHDRRYTVYLDVFTTDEWNARRDSLRAAQQREVELAARTVDVLRIGEMQAERDHNLRGERTAAGEAFGRKWRHATDGGWFSFDLEVDPDAQNELLLTYWGGETGNRVFDVLVNDKKITTQKLLQNRPNEFFDVSHLLPLELTEGRSKVTVRLQAQEAAWAGGLFGARSLRAK